MRVCQLVEEALQGLGVAARCGPHDPRPVVVGYTGEKPAVKALPDLVLADVHQPVQGEPNKRSDLPPDDPDAIAVLSGLSARGTRR